MKFKRMLAAAMAVAVVFGTFAAVPDNAAKSLGAVSASAVTFTKSGFSGDYEYGFDSDNKLYIKTYNGTDATVKVADQFEIDDEMVPVYGIATGAFANNTDVKNVTIGKNIKRIEGGAFENCTSLESLSFDIADDKAELVICEMAFAGCSSLMSVNFPLEPKGSVAYIFIDSFAFLDCPALKSVIIPKYVEVSSFSPAFGYKQTDKAEYPTFTKEEDGTITTNLEKDDTFIMCCYRHSSAANSAVYCGLIANYIDGVYELDQVKSAVSEVQSKNSNYSITMTDTGFKGDRVNNLEGYADVINEYYLSYEDLISGYSDIATHKIIDTENTEPLLEYGTVYPYSSYDAAIDNGIVSVNCFGEGMILNEYEYFMDLIPLDSKIVSKEKLDAVRSSMTYKTAKPRYCDINGTNKFEHNCNMGTAMHNGYAYLVSIEEGASAEIVDKTGKTVLSLPQSFSRVAYSGKNSGSNLFTISTFTMGSSIDYGCNKGLIPFSSQYSHNGSTIFDAPCEKEDFDGWGTDAVSDYKHCGYIDLKGNIVIPQQYADGGAFSDDGLAWVVSPEQINKYGYYGSGTMAVYPIYGYIDTKGNTAIPFEYSDAYDFDSGYAAVKKGTKYGMIDTKNNAVIPFEYEDSKGAKGGFMTAMKDGKWGMVDKYGNAVIPFVFEDVSLFDAGKAFAVSDGKVYRFDIKEGADYLFGDVNNDGKVDIEDAVKVIGHINGITPLTSDEETRADTTFNGDIDIEDAVLIINQVNGVSVIKPPASMG